MAAEAATVNTLFDVNQLRGWLPVDAVVEGGRPGLTWMNLEGVSFDEPFLHQTVERIKRERTETVERFTEFDALLQVEKIVNGLTPAGFIFHSSRCGSTVLTNACRALEHSVVVSEAYALDKIIGRLFTDVGGSKTRELLYSILVRSAVNLLGQPRKESDNHYFVKFSSMSVLQQSRLRKIWPDVPRVFVYRHPVEVMVSNLDDPPQWMDFEKNREMAAAILGTPIGEIADISREEFCARALGRFYKAAAGMDGNPSSLFNYEDLSLQSLVDLIKFFAVDPTDAEREAIAKSLSIHAKDAGRTRRFRADSQSKRAAASRMVWEMAEQWAMEPYRKLEQIRTDKINFGN